MSIPSDNDFEMPNEHLFDDEAIESILSGRPVGRDDLDSLAAIVEDITFMTQVEPAPSPRLAGILEGGFSAEKGDLLATAASNVNGPALQAAGLPKWRKEDPMERTSLVSIFLAKLAGMRAAAKMAVSSAAISGITLAGGAAGVLPGAMQNAVADVVATVSPFEFPTDGGPVVISDGTQAIEGSIDVASGGDVSAGADNFPGGGTTTTLSPSAGASATGASNSTSITAPPVTVPALGAIEVPACVGDLLPAGGVPDLGALLAKAPACVQSLIGTLNLPTEVAQCVNSIVASLPTNGTVGSITSVANVNLAGCVPVDVSTCVNNLMGSLSGVTGGLNNLTNLAGLDLTALTQLANLNLGGCVPQNVTQCLTSLLGGLAATTPGSLPDMNLSACLPVNQGGLLNGIPALGSIGNLGNVANLGGITNTVTGLLGGTVPQ